MDTAIPPIPPTIDLIRLGDVGSTNDEARRLAASGARDGTLVRADSQNRGRGRQGRNWDSPPGNLYMSLLLRPDVAPGRALQLGFVASLSIAEAIAAGAPATGDVQVKWPNDVLVNGGKVCGMLLESSMKADGSAVEWVVIGMGINVKAAPDGTAWPATSLAAEGMDVTPGDLLRAIVQRIESWRGRWRDEGFSPVREAWLARAAGLGGPVVARLPGETLAGTFSGLDETGALLLDLEAGGRRHIAMGDVFPAGTGSGGDR